VGVLSVDLGTSNTVAVLSAHGRPPRVVEVDGSATMPSAAFADEDGNLTVGREAERRARLDPSRFEPNPKRRIDEGTLLLGDTVVPVTDVLAAVLRRVVEETSRQLGGTRPDEVRLTHPAQWGLVRRNVLLSAARQAGMNSKILLVPEPVAAAAHFASFPGQSLAPGQALAVYDLGAGTFDVAVVGATADGFLVLAEAGLPDLGGLDVDQALLEHVGRQVSHREPVRWQRLLRPETTGDRRAQRTLREDVKAAKEALSSHPQTEVPMPEPFEDVLVTRAELEALVRPNLLRSVELLGSTVRSTGMTPQRLAGIYLVGGSSRMPLVASLIAEQLRVVPTTLDQPETAVALGVHQSGVDGSGTHTQGQSTPAAFADDGPTQSIVPAVPGFRPPAPTFPATGPAAAFPQSGPHRIAQPVAQHSVGPPPQLSHGYPPRPPASKRPDRKSWLIAAGAFVAVAAAAVTVVLVTNGGGNDTGADGGATTTPTTSVTRGGNSVASGDESTDYGGACAGQRADGEGFTPCLREFAGSVPDEFSCVAGMATTGGPPMSFPGATIVTCTREPYQVVYWQLPSEDLVETTVGTLVGQTGSLNVEPEYWQGSGLDGRYWNMELGGGAGILMFTAAGRPVLGMLINDDVSTSGSSGSGSLVRYFEDNVRP